MENTIRLIVDNLNMLRSTRIEEVSIQLKNLIAAYRDNLTEQNTQLINAPTVEDYAALLNGVADTVDIVQVLVRAVEDMNKLQASAERVMARVYKRLPTLTGQPS